jgi:DNA-binding LacI/PurR family transcriptional regulator
MATIHDVAREAGVGLGTVSRVLSESPNVAPATRRRVEAAMTRLDYRPSPAARALRRKRTDTLEIVVPMFTRDFYVEVLRGIEAALLETDFSLVIRTVERAGDRDRVFARVGERGGADGLLIVSLAPTPELLQRLRVSQVCAVLIDGQVPELPSVAVDHEPISMQAMQHLLDLGRRHIALIDRRNDPFVPTAVSGRQTGSRAISVIETARRQGLRVPRICS